MKMLVVFEKGDRLRHIGHLDLLRTMQRALRRSDLPLQYSQGFNPHILLNFAAPLSVGMPGSREIMEVPISKDIPAEQFAEQLKKALPPDLKCISARAVDDRHPAPMALLKAAIYEITLENGEALLNAVPDFLKQKEIPAIRKTKSGEKPCDLRPMIYELKVEDGKLMAMLALCEAATCKPDLLLTALSSFAGVEKPRAYIIRRQLLGEWNGILVPLENL